MYRHTTGYIGHLKEVPAHEMLAKNPERAIELAVGGMLPEGILGHRLKGKLKVYKGSEHPHIAQNPQAHAIKSNRKQK
jgi:large subunit ribosomal protein L13